MIFSKIAVFLFFAALSSSKAQDCGITEEFRRVIYHAIPMFEPEARWRIDSGCFSAFITGETINCDSLEFTSPQAPSCQAAIKDANFKNKIKEYNLNTYKAMIENAIYSMDVDAEDICQKLQGEGDKFFATVKKLFDNKDNSTYNLYQKYCKMDPAVCGGLYFPQETQDYLSKDVAPAFRDFVKIVTDAVKGVPEGRDLSQGIELMFGSGEFETTVFKCATELLNVITNYRKQFF